MGLIVDTNVFIAAITVSELLAGVILAKTAGEKIHRHAFVENILNTLPVLDFDTEVARTYAELYAFALSQGKRKQLNAHDLQIAATALVYAHSILTANTSDFKNIPCIRVINSHSNSMIHEDNTGYSP